MKLKKELGLLEVFSISAGAMISSGIFILPSLAFLKSGPASIIAYLIASIVVIPTILSKSELSTAMPKTGGIYFFTDRSMGPLAGTLGGFTAWFSLAFKTAFALLGMSIFIELLDPNFSDLHMKLVAVACCLVFTGINLVGVKLTGKIQVVIVLSLLALLLVYIGLGSFHIDLNRLTPFTPNGIGSIAPTVGLIFVAFTGTTKIASIAGEVKNPGKTMPLGMFLSWGIVSLIYIAVMFITISIIDPVKLSGSLTPLSLGGEVISNFFGLVIMSIAAILAFVSTANVGILAASRDPFAMAKDELLPDFFTKISKRGTPWTSILSTSAIILVVVFIDLENFVKTASALKLILFILANLSLIFMRESNMRHYQPKYKSPFYPWAQIIGIIIYTILLLHMGKIPLLIVGIFTVLGLIWYYIYAHKRIKREYALLHIIEKITGVKSTDNLLDEELREILVERDKSIDERFVKIIKKCIVLDYPTSPLPSELIGEIAKIIRKRLRVSENKIYKTLLNSKKNASTMLKPGVIVLPIMVPGKGKSDVILVRCRKSEPLFMDNKPTISVFVIAASKDEYHFYLHVLSKVTQVVSQPNFNNRWLNAVSDIELQNLTLSHLIKMKKN